MEHLAPGSRSHVKRYSTKIGNWTVYVTYTDPDLKIFEFNKQGVYLNWKDNKLQVTEHFSDCNNIFNTKGNKLLHDQSQKYIFCNGGKRFCVEGKDAKCVLTGKKYGNYCR